jgi:glycyl-tRNA synthetase
MSLAIYPLAGLRFWTQQEIALREQYVQRLSYVVEDTLTEINPAWYFARVEGPLLVPHTEINPNYTGDDVFETNHDAMGGRLCLRAETTATTYAYARHINQSDRRARFPLCVWQLGKSFRRELVDGATAGRLRYNEFYQLEFQCIFSNGTKADYMTALVDSIGVELQSITGLETRLVDSDRLPSYSTRTLDIEAKTSDGKWRELASCSLRTDFSPDHTVAEIAIGMDRVMDIK